MATQGCIGWTTDSRRRPAQHSPSLQICASGTLSGPHRNLRLSRLVPASRNCGAGVQLQAGQRRSWQAGRRAARQRARHVGPALTGLHPDASTTKARGSTASLRSSGIGPPPQQICWRGIKTGNLLWLCSLHVGAVLPKPSKSVPFHALHGAPNKPSAAQATRIEPGGSSLSPPALVRLKPHVWASWPLQREVVGGHE